MINNIPASAKIVVETRKNMGFKNCSKIAPTNLLIISAVKYILIPYDAFYSEYPWSFIKKPCMLEFMPTSAPTIKNIAITIASTNLLVNNFMHDENDAGISDFIFSSIFVVESHSIESRVTTA